MYDKCDVLVEFLADQEILSESFVAEVLDLADDMWVEGYEAAARRPSLTPIDIGQGLLKAPNTLSDVELDTTNPKEILAYLKGHADDDAEEIIINYVSSEGKRTVNRRIEPIEVFGGCSAGDRAILAANDVDKDAPRNFIIGNIERLRA